MHFLVLLYSRGDADAACVSFILSATGVIIGLIDSSPDGLNLARKVTAVR